MQNQNSDAKFESAENRVPLKKTLSSHPVRDAKSKARHARECAAGRVQSLREAAAGGATAGAGIHGRAACGDGQTAAIHHRGGGGAEQFFEFSRSAGGAGRRLAVTNEELDVVGTVVAAVLKEGHDRAGG